MRCRWRRAVRHDASARDPERTGKSPARAQTAHMKGELHSSKGTGNRVDELREPSGAHESSAAPAQPQLHASKNHHSLASRSTHFFVVLFEFGERDEEILIIALVAGQRGDGALVDFARPRDVAALALELGPLDVRLHLFVGRVKRNQGLRDWATVNATSSKRTRRSKHKNKPAKP
mgnify:CR=1 FL=1